MSPKLAFLGLGNMGRGMSSRLARHAPLSSPLLLWNRSAHRATALSSALGPSRALAAPSLGDAVRASDIVFTCLGDDSAVLATYASALSLDVAGKLFVDCSTVQPRTSDRLAELCAAAGAEFVACPVWGPPAAAEAGTLVCIPAGPPASVARLRPYTVGVLARAILDLSGRPHGTAALAKLVGNSFVFNMVSALAEGVTLAETTGLGADVVGEFVALMFGGPYVGYFERMKNGDYYKKEPLFAVDLGLKDIDHTLALGRESGAKLGGLENARSHLLNVKKVQGDKGDMAGMYGAARADAGLPFENEGGSR